MQKQNYVILGIILITVLVFAGAVFVREKGEESAVTPAPIPQKPPVITPPPIVTPPIIPTSPTTPTPEGWKTYENTKYKYSFSYPLSYYIYQFVDFGVPEKITIDADDASISETKSAAGTVFSIRAMNVETLSEDFIKTRFGATNPDDINLTKTVIASRLAYNVEFKKKGEWQVSGFYFMQNLNNQVMEVTILKNNDTAQKILSSLRFTQ